MKFNWVFLSRNQAVAVAETQNNNNNYDDDYDQDDGEEKMPHNNTMPTIQWQ